MSDRPCRYRGLAPTSQTLQYYAVFLVLLAICVALSLLSNVFTTIDNLGNVSEQVSVVGVTAMGMTLLLVSGQYRFVGGRAGGVDRRRRRSGGEWSEHARWRRRRPRGRFPARRRQWSDCHPVGGELAGRDARQWPCLWGPRLPAVRIAANRADRPELFRTS